MLSFLGNEKVLSPISVEALSPRDTTRRRLDRKQDSILVVTAPGFVVRAEIADRRFNTGEAMKTHWRQAGQVRTPSGLEALGNAKALCNIAR
jgi:hypothetical protein